MAAWECPTEKCAWFHQTSYDFDLGVYDNYKDNLLADRLSRNRWGKKFGRMWKKHMEGADPTVGTYDFTLGMRATVSTREEMQTDLDEMRAFRTAMRESFVVDDGAGNWSIAPALRYSYMTATLTTQTRADDDPLLTADSSIVGLSMALCIDAGADRKERWGHSSGALSAVPVELRRLVHEDDDFGVRLVSDDGNSYGHYDGGLRAGTLCDNALDMYSVEEHGSGLFAEDQDAKYAAIWGDLQKYLYMAIKIHSPADGSTVGVMMGLDQFLHWIDGRIADLEQNIEEIENSGDRVEDDLALIDHLQIGDSLAEQIDDPGDIERIWFRMDKTVSAPMIADGDLDGGSHADQSYAWWEEEQFDEVRKHVKNFQQYCEVSWGSETGGDSGTATPTVVTPKLELFEKAGYKTYWFVVSFLDIGVKMEDPSWLERLFGLLVLIVSIYLTVLTDNPEWLKGVIITNQVANYLGVGSPELSLLTTAIGFGYGIYQTDFSTMGSSDIFNFAVKNVSMVGKMAGYYEMIQLRGEMAKEQVDLVEEQEQQMRYIYGDAYDEYDRYYAMLFEPFVPQIEG